MSSASAAVATPTQVCGNAILEPPEACDEGNTFSQDGCSFDCLAVAPGYACRDSACSPICGDGMLTKREFEDRRCDDGNVTPGDGCSELCRVEFNYTCGTPGEPCEKVRPCGDGELDTGEMCDPAAPGVANCNDDCSLRTGYSCTDDLCSPVCSDGLVVDHEQCDDGNLSSGDGCDERCRLEPFASCDAEGAPCSLALCGDGELHPSEVCDDGNVEDGDGCTPDCKLLPVCEPEAASCTGVCGDGLLSPSEPNEECDDGNRFDGDGCSKTCKQEAGYECTPNSAASAAASDAGVAELDGGSAGLATLPRAAAPRRTLPKGFSAGGPCSPVCGDGIVTLGENCDDGLANADAYGACATDCQSQPRCGDGIVGGSELCDDGINSSLYRIRPTDCARGCFAPAYCGDGVVDRRFNEQCDLGPRNIGAYEGCNPDCTLGPHCGDGVVDREFEDCDTMGRSTTCSMDCSRIHVR